MHAITTPLKRAFDLLAAQIDAMISQTNLASQKT
jgi:hypothetical protein